LDSYVGSTFSTTNAGAPDVLPAVDTFLKEVVEAAEARPTRRSASPPPEEPPHAASECVTLCEDALLEAIRTGHRGLAGGGTGWFVEHVQWLGMTNGRAFDALHKTLSLVASGAVPPQGAALLGACSLVALPKGPNAVRPIAVGEVLRRIVVHALCIQFRKPMAALFGPLPYGVLRCIVAVAR
jgi:hypothetical protein